MTMVQLIIKTKELCIYYAGIDSRIKVINKKNGGVASARNCGIDNSHGQYLCFIDGDDYVHKDWLKSFCSLIEKQPEVDFIIGRMSSFLDGTDFLEPKSHFVKNEIVEGQKGEHALINITKAGRFSMGVRGAYKRDMIIDNKIYFPVNSYYEDIYWTFKAMTYAEHVMSNENPFYYWRMRGDSVSREVKVSDAMDIFNVLKEIYSYYPKFSDIGTFRSAISKIIKVRFIAKYIKYAKELNLADLDVFNEMIKNSRYLISKCYDRSSVILRILFCILGVEIDNFFYKKIS